MIIRRISELMNGQESPSIKFFMTSRPNAEAALEVKVDPSKLTVLPQEDKQEQITADITLVIQHRLERIIKRGSCTPAVSKVLKQLLIAKADRTFLWITLVLPLFEERQIPLPPDVESLATQLPSDLASLYKHLLLSIPKGDHATAAKMLRLLVTSDRPLTGDELGIMMNIGPQHRSTSSFTADQLLINEKSAQAALGPLVRVYNSKLELVHQSLKDYLINLSEQSQDLFASTFGVDIVRGKKAVVTACSFYLALDEFCNSVLAEDGPSSSPSDNSAVSDLLSPKIRKSSLDDDLNA